MFLRRSALSIVLVSAALSSAYAAAPRVGDKAPEIKAAAWLSGPALSLAQLNNRVVVIEFWATWCGPCVDNIPHLGALQAKYKNQGVVVMGLTDEAMSQVKQFVKTTPMGYAVGTGSRTGNTYGVSGIPHAVVVAPGGKIVWSGHPADGLEAAVVAALKKATAAR